MYNRMYTIDIKYAWLAFALQHMHIYININTRIKHAQNIHNQLHAKSVDILIINYCNIKMYVINI